MSNSSSFGKLVFQAALGIIWIVIFFVGNCGAPDPKLKRSLESQAMTQVSVGDWNPWECGAGDTISRSFTARNSLNQSVSGTVCCGFWIKGCTVRW